MASAAIIEEFQRLFPHRDFFEIKGLIRKCLEFGYIAREGIEKLHTCLRIERECTDFVWKKLEDMNPHFFQNYYMLRIITDHVDLYNNLLHQYIEVLKARHGELLEWTANNIIVAGEINKFGDERDVHGSTSRGGGGVGREDAQRMPLMLENFYWRNPNFDYDNGPVGAYVSSAPFRIMRD